MSESLEQELQMVLSCQHLLFSIFSLPLFLSSPPPLIFSSGPEEVAVPAVGCAVFAETSKLACRGVPDGNGICFPPF